MARKMRKFSAGGAQGKYDRRMADIKKDFEKDSAGKSGKALEVLTAKRAQRIADAEDDRAKRTGADRTATRAAEKAAESNLTRTRKFGADKPVAKTEPAKTEPAKTEPAKAPEEVKAKPQSFAAAFKDARSRLGAGKTFTYNGKSFTTNIAGEGRKAPTPGRTGTGTGASTSGSSVKKDVGTTTPVKDVKPTTPPAGAPKGDTTVAILQAQKSAREKLAQKNPTKDAPKAAPAAKRYETPAAAKARVAKLTGNAKQLNNLAGVFGADSVSNAEARAKLLAAREKEKALNIARAKGNKPLVSGTDTGAFFTYGKAAAEKNAANKAKGGKVKKEKTMKYANGGSTPSKRMPIGGKQLMPMKKKPPKEPITGGADTVPLTPGRKEFLKELAKRNAEPKKYAAGGVTKEMPSSKAMGSMGMAKGGKAKAKAKAKGKPFAATKFGAALMKKSADTKGRAMMKFAKGGSIDGCAQRGKTKVKQVTMKKGGSC